MSAPDPGMSDEAVLAGTGHDWAHWLIACDALGGRNLSHSEIARALADTGIPHWWRQMVTVGYERMIGRRELGQTCAGDYSAAASRTLAGEMDAALSRWCEVAAGRVDFAGTTVTGEPRTSSTAKWRYWRVDLDDGSKVTLNFANKPGGKVSVAVNHDKLGSAEAAAAAKAFWKEALQAL